MATSYKTKCDCFPFVVGSRCNEVFFLTSYLSLMSALENLPFMVDWLFFNGVLTVFSRRYGAPRRWRSGLERSPRKRKVGCSNPSRDRPKSLKRGSDSSTAKRSALGVSVTGPRR